MRSLYAVSAIAGIAVALLGLLWLLQGAGVIRVCPILCFADCGCMEGGSALWEAAGAAALVFGIALVWWGIAGGRKR